MKRWFRNLSEFVAALERAGELKTVARPVSHYLDISRYTDAESKSPRGGKALFFKTVKGSPFPAATNLFGSPKRICMALGVDDLDRLGDRIRRMIEMSPPNSFKDVLGLLPTALSVSRFFPRRSRTKRPPCQEVVYTGEAVELGLLPVLHCWPKDAGRFITLPLVFTRSLKTGRRNVGMYRLQVFDKNTTGMHWHVHKDGSHYYNEYRRAGRRMPVSVAIGADPATIYAATAPLPRNVDEMILSGFIRNQPVSMARCLTNDLEVPAEAEFVLEGYVDPHELRREGPFGDHTGYYSLADDYPVFHVTALTHRRSPVYCATLVGRPPMEDCYLAKATERMFLPLLQTAFPEIIDYWLPWEGVFHNIVVVSIDKEYAGHAQKVMYGLWGQGQMSFCKAIVVVDKDVDLKNPPAIMRRLLESFDARSDITLAKGVLDVLDHSSPTANFGNKIGIDLTVRFVGEPERKATEQPESNGLPTDRDLLESIRRQISGIGGVRQISDPDGARERPVPLNRVLCLNIERDAQLTKKKCAQLLLGMPVLTPYAIMVLYDAEVDLADKSLLLWKLFNNVDPGRDLHLQNHRLVIDACKKGVADGHVREWPDELRFD
jgi:4-hydroxy-3-polyprenylbenzoate decarboxylase